MHMLVWTTDALKYKENSDEAIEAYVDQYVTCILQENDALLKHLVELQVHMHSKTCKKVGKQFVGLDFLCHLYPEQCCFNHWMLI